MSQPHRSGHRGAAGPGHLQPRRRRGGIGWGGLVHAWRARANAGGPPSHHRPRPADRQGAGERVGLGWRGRVHHQRAARACQTATTLARATATGRGPNHRRGMIRVVQGNGGKDPPVGSRLLCGWQLREARPRIAPDPVFSGSRSGRSRGPGNRCRPDAGGRSSAPDPGSFRSTAPPNPGYDRSRTTR